MSTQNWRLNIDTAPNELRAEVWSETLALLLLRFERHAQSPSRLSGSGWITSSTLESTYAELRASAQTLYPDWEKVSGHLAHGGQAVMVMQVLSGIAEISTGSGSVSIENEDTLVLDPTQTWSIDFKSDFHALFICLKGVSILLRLLRSIPDGYIQIHKGSGITSAIHSLTQSITGSLDTLQSEELSQIEIALEGLLLANLSQHRGPKIVDGKFPNQTSTTQLSNLKRICRAIELQLSDPLFSLQELVEKERVSSRYVQKLFLGIGTNFTEYLRKRRLERCRQDLADPSLKHMTILEICNRWGFNDSANFSRAFSREYHVTPREFRTLPALSSGKYHRGSPLVSKPACQADPIESSDDMAFLSSILESTLTPVFDDPSPGTSHHLAATRKTVHWGFFSKTLKPVLTIESGDFLTIDTLTQHAYDDYELMIKGDPDAESIFHWDAHSKTVNRRGAGPLDGSIYGRGPGEGFGVHICTGPVAVHGAQPGDILEVRILDIELRPCPSAPAKSYGSNAATWWGYHYHDLITPPKHREVVTVYEIEATGYEKFARAVYAFRWTPQTDPAGIRHERIDYPGIPVDHDTIEKNYDVLRNVRIPVRPHFGVLAIAPDLEGNIDSIPPGAFGGNIDNWRASAGASVFLPVQVADALFSVGDPHASQGDGEICGTAIECSLTGKFQLVLHRKAGAPEACALDFPYIETPEEWVILGFSYPNYLSELGPTAQSDIYKKSTLDMAMRDTFRKTRKFLMVARGLSEDEAISLMSVAIDFGLSQIVNGNIGIHAIIRKSLFISPHSYEGERHGEL